MYWQCNCVITQYYCIIRITRFKILNCSIIYSFKEGLKIANRIENGKLRLLVNRICQSLQMGIRDKIFSDEEEEKLMVSLSLEQNEVHNLLRVITLIYTQAAYGIVKPAVMEAFMKDHFEIEEDKITILLQAWITHAKEIVDTFRQKSIFPTQVTISLVYVILFIYF